MQSRYIVMDAETNGIYPFRGSQVIEVATVELRTGEIVRFPE